MKKTAGKAAFGAAIVVGAALSGCGGSSNSGGPVPPPIVPLASTNLIGLTTNNQLVSFNSATPGTLSATRAITGLQANETLLGIDTRTATNELFALSDNLRLYRLNAGTGAATFIGQATLPTAVGTAIGFDFNPAVDRIRVVTDTGLNFRINPNTGAVVDFDANPANGTQLDGALNYKAGDTNAGDAVQGVGAGYTRSRNPAPVATDTQLFVIDAANDVLALQAPPNEGVLTTIGSLGVNIGSQIGFDIVSDTTVNNQGVGIAAFNVGNTSRLYSINLQTGLATNRGDLGNGNVTITDIAVRP